MTPKRATGGALMFAMLAPLAHAGEQMVTPDRVTHYRACEELNHQCVEAIEFPEGTQSWYFRWKQCDETRRECVKHPVPASAVEAVTARRAREEAEAKRRAREQHIFPEMASDSEIADYNSRVPVDDQLVCKPEQVTGSHRTLNNCRTRREIRESEERAQEELRRDRLKSPQGVPGS